MPKDDTGPVRSVQRALHLLDLVAHRDSLALSELAEAAGIAPSTTHRLLATLVDAGFVDQVDSSRHYRPGTRLLGLVAAAERRLGPLRAAAHPLMTELAAISGETVHLNTLDGPFVVFVDQVLGPRSIRVDVELGTRVAAHVTAAGKAMIAAGGEPLLAPLLQSGLPQFTPRTITTPEKLRRELTLARRRGWASEVEEHELGAACVAATIPLGPGAPNAALSISGPTSRLRGPTVTELGELLATTGERVARLVNLTS